MIIVSKVIPIDNLPNLEEKMFFNEDEMVKAVADVDKDIRVTWFDMPVSMQISNIGSEVSRAINWKNKGNDKRKVGFCEKAIQFLELSIEDPKNRYRVGEFSFCIEELKDYFLGENIYGTTDEMLHKYYDAFI